MNLSAHEIKNYLDVKYQNINIEIFDTIPSTNSYAKQAVNQKQITNTSLIVANCQTAGRGRFDRKFFSPAQTGIYMTLVLFPKQKINDVLLVTIISAKKLTGITLNIKWVNDILFNSKKVAGILTETVLNAKTNTVESLITGIGINVTTENFPDELKNIAASLNINISRNKLIAEIINIFFNLYNDNEKAALINRYKKYLILNKNIIYYIDNKKLKGKIIDITNSANLIVETNGKNIILNSGEIFFDE